MFLIDIDLISMIFKISFSEFSAFPGARLLPNHKNAVSEHLKFVGSKAYEAEMKHENKTKLNYKLKDGTVQYVDFPPFSILGFFVLFSILAVFV